MQRGYCFRFAGRDLGYQLLSSAVLRATLVKGPVCAVNLYQVEAGARTLCLLGHWHTDPPLRAKELSVDILTLPVHGFENNAINMKNNENSAYLLTGDIKNILLHLHISVTMTGKLDTHQLILLL